MLCVAEGGRTSPTLPTHTMEAIPVRIVSLGSSATAHFPNCGTETKLLVQAMDLETPRVAPFRSFVASDDNRQALVPPRDKSNAHRPHDGLWEHCVAHAAAVLTDDVELQL